MRVGLIQLNASDDPTENLRQTLKFVRSAIDDGADLVLTPEVTNCVSASRPRQTEVLQTESEDVTLAALRDVARNSQVPILIGSLALKQDGVDDRFVNRSILIDGHGTVAARYDKIHMFDIQVSETESYQESKGYRPGEEAVLADVAGASLGMTICYDLRFPHLYRTLAHAGAQIVSIPSAFTKPTGEAHWEVLLRARAIETGCFVLAPAQCGTHAAVQGRARQTYGHSLAVDPWGRVLADGGEEPGVTMVDLKLEDVDDARRRIPSLKHDRDYVAP
ncbi:MAG: carbon-nitrogen hydrolase family protein [Boseongicola sp.]|nr:carbon-nitrogen hydrolase family protein [Boseongicola sp.]MDD9978107.1 carbon-nitrogen hydrolase family protein [Boseongicola sp.]